MTPCHCNTHKPRRYGRDTWIALALALLSCIIVYALCGCGGFDCPFGTVRVPDPVTGYRCEPAPRGEAACDGRREVCE